MHPTAIIAIFLFFWRKSGMAQRCKTPLLWLTQLIIGILPPTRLFPLKAKLLSISGVDIHPSVRLCSSFKIATSGYLAIGAHTFIGHQVLIGGGDASITIGSNCDIAPRVMILSGSHEIAVVGPKSAGKGYSKPIVIEDGVWIGGGSIILGGVRIGQHSVIGAGSVVTRDIPPHCVAVGSPCRVIRSLSDETEA
jgi:maltose O-acetyltransferase